MLDVYKAIDDIADHLVSKGVDIPNGYKRRDPREPGRTQKEVYEDKLARLIKRRFNNQKKEIAERLRWTLPKKGIDDWMDRVEIPKDPDTEKRVLQLFIGALDHGRQLFGEVIGFDIDYDQFDEKASDWAVNYTNDFFDGLDETSEITLRQELVNFVEVDGYTIDDVTSGLASRFANRPQRIAVTEITRVYAEADDIAGKVVEEECPDVRVVKTWFTNNDDLVCDICGPMNGVSVLRKDKFNTIAGPLDGPPAHPNCRCWRQTETDILGEMKLGE